MEALSDYLTNPSLTLIGLSCKVLEDQLKQCLWKFLVNYKELQVQDKGPEATRSLVEPFGPDSPALPGSPFSCRQRRPVTLTSFWPPLIRARCLTLLDGPAWL